MEKDGIVKFAKTLVKCLICHSKANVTKWFLASIDRDEEKKNLFLASLEGIKKELDADLDFFYESDPAADSKEEIVLAYPGYLAITYYRLAHEIYQLGYHLKARIISEEAHLLTGIDIHPGAKISSPFFIDHGTGIVIGETSIIGRYVKIYQGVTLGALSLGRGRLIKGLKRHPTIGDHVTIYAGASILGGDVIVGNNVVIGSNVFLLKSTPDNVRVTLPEPELIVTPKSKK